MQVSPDQLLQFIGQLYVENQLLNRQIDMQSDAIRNHMATEHPEPKAEASNEGQDEQPGA